MIAFRIIIDLFMTYKYPICDVFHLFCKIARFFATEPLLLRTSGQKPCRLTKKNKREQQI